MRRSASFKTFSSPASSFMPSRAMSPPARMSWRRTLFSSTMPMYSCTFAAVGTKPSSSDRPAAPPAMSSLPWRSSSLASVTRSTAPPALRMSRMHEKIVSCAGR